VATKLILTGGTDSRKKTKFAMAVERKGVTNWSVVVLDPNVSEKPTGKKG
jgi:hypothetical protein